MPPTRAVEAVLFDLLTALLDSWTLWDSVAGGAGSGRRWREEYLRLTYAAGAYRPYESLVAEAASRQGLDAALSDALTSRWHELKPWPEAPAVLRSLKGRVKLGVVTNCSELLGRSAAAQVGIPFDVVVTAEAAGAYKPHPKPYLDALAELGLAPERVLFVAGSPSDVGGAAGVGMSVWWHNRIGIERQGATLPIAEHASLEELPSDLATCGDQFGV